MTTDGAAATEEGTSKGGGGTTKEDAQYGGGHGKLHGGRRLRLGFLCGGLLLEIHDAMDTAPNNGGNATSLSGKRREAKIRRDEKDMAG